jgi:CDP-diacylglycerol--glycerol-3-phosphate 3-phosphatidyltransferase
MAKLNFSWRHHRKNVFQKADKIYWHDQLLARTVLKLLPKRIYPNYLTLFRFLATPMVVWLMLLEKYYIGLIAFLVVAFTDALDGAMARTRNQVTDWGKIYDPVADKILIGSMVFVIVLKYIDFWAAIIIIILEIIIVLAAWQTLKKGQMVQANIWGKIKMCLQTAGVTILLLAIVFHWAALLPLASGSFYLAIAFAIVSLLTHGI